MRLSPFPPLAAVLLASLVLSSSDTSTAPVISVSLDPLSLVSSTAPTVSPNEPLSSPPKSNTGLEDAVKVWEDLEECHRPFFSTASAKSREESKYAEFYNDVIGNLSTNDPQRYRELGEVGSFVEQFLREPNFECSLQNNCCRVELHCDELVRRMNKTMKARGEQVSTAELLADARKGWSSFSKLLCTSYLDNVSQCESMWY